MPSLQPSALKQITALMTLQWRHWQRGQLNPRVTGNNARRARGILSSALILRLFFVAFVVNSLFGLAKKVVALNEARFSATVWLIGSVAACLFFQQLSLDVPVRQARAAPPLQNPWLETLPLRLPTRFVLLQLRLAIFVLCFTLLVFLCGDGLHQWVEPGVLLVVLGLVWALAVSSCAIAVGYGLRLWLTPSRYVQLSRVTVMFSIAAILVAGLSSLLGTYVPISVGPAWLHVVAEDRVELSAMTWLIPSLLILLGPAATFYAERRGYDRIEAGPANRQRFAREEKWTWNFVQRRLWRRETLVSQYILFGIIAAGLAVCLYYVKTVPVPSKPGTATHWVNVLQWIVSALIVELASITALNQASRSVARDQAARPLLSVLPMPPADTLGGKVALIRWQCLPLLVLFIPILLWAPVSLWSVLWWRIPTLALALWLFSGAAVAVAFLSSGGGTISGATSAPNFNLNSLLLTLPLGSVLLAQDFATAVPSLVSLVMISFEARRAALLSVRWLDDGDEDVERDTQVWRALIVFAGFVASQGLFSGVLGFVDLQPLTLMSLIYWLSATALLLLVWSRKPAALSIQFLPRQRWWLPVGLVVGTCSGYVARGYLWVLDHFGVMPDDKVGDALTPTSVIWFGLAVVVAAPIAEEVFFRGWLLRAVSGDLGLARRRWAVPLTALAFGLVHPPLSVLPVAFLGLCVGYLYEMSGGLSVAMVAHAAHNAIALLAAQ